LILVIDNYDSFTWNLVQYLGELGTEPVVRRNDEITVEEVRQLAPDRIVISPGPCTPMEAGVSIELIREVGPEVPTLGVCLGHQAIGAAFGGEVVRARRVMHGKVCPIRHRATDIFDQLPTPLRVTRYHSLVVEPSSLPDELEAIAWTDEVGFEDEIQALRHRRFPIWGVQFHPESIASEGGHQMLRNFLAL
jgi:anthranilate synthase/aminodeoxychorismate synthase-like glutamine amidotransferase